MKRRDFIRSSALAAGGIVVARSPFGKLQEVAQLSRQRAATRKILIAGGNYGEAFVRYMATLTGKPRPRLSYLPTASADRADGIITWYRTCAPLSVEPRIQESITSSNRHTKAFDAASMTRAATAPSGGD